MSNIIDDLRTNPLDTFNKLFKENFFIQLTLCANLDKNPQKCLDMMNLMSYMVDIAVQYEIKSKTKDLCIKLYDTICNSKVLDNMSKIICGSHLSLDSVRKLMSSIAISIIKCVPEMKTQNRINFIYAITRMVYDSFHTRHLFISITFIDSIMLNKNKILDQNQYMIYVENMKINEKNPKYISDWIDSTSNISCVSVMSLGLYPVLMFELIRLSYPSLNNMHHLRKLITKIKKSLKNFDSPIVKNVLIACDECLS